MDYQSSKEFFPPMIEKYKTPNPTLMNEYQCTKDIPYNNFVISKLNVSKLLQA